MRTKTEILDNTKQVKTRLIELRDLITTETRDFSSEERSEIDKIFDQLACDRQDLQLIDETSSEKRGLEDFRITMERAYATPEHKLSKVEEFQLQYRQAWYDYLLNGENGASKSSIEMLSNGCSRKALSVKQATRTWTSYAEKALDFWDKYTQSGLESEWGTRNPETRDQLLVPDSAGGFLVPQGFSEELIEQMKYWGGMREVSRIYPTATGNQVDWPSYDDTAAVATIVGEAAAIPEQDIVFGQKQLNAYKYTSGYVDVSWELLQDSFFNFEALLARAFAIRFGRGTNLHFTSGNGTTQPEGIVTATNNTLDLTTGGALAYQDVVNLKYSVNKIYREMPDSRFMFNDEIEKRLMLISTSEAMPLWAPSIRDGAPDTVLGIPYTINNDMSTDFAVGADKPPVMLYGQLSTYLIRDVAPMSMMRLDELKALNGLVTFLAWSRHDGRFMSAVANTGDTPVKGLKPAAA